MQAGKRLPAGKGMKSVKMPAEVHAQIKAEAEKNTRTFTGQMIVIIRDYFENEKNA